MPNQKSKFEDFKARRKTDECVAQLPWESTQAHSSFKNYPYHEISGSKPYNYYLRNNVKINDGIVRLLAKKIVLKIRSLHIWPQIEALVLEALMGCSSAFELHSLLRSIYRDYPAFNPDLSLAESWVAESARFKKYAFQQDAIRLADPRLSSDESRLLYSLSIAAGATSRHWNPSAVSWSPAYTTGINAEWKADDLKMADIVSSELIMQSLQFNEKLRKLVETGKGTEKLFGSDFGCFEKIITAELRPTDREEFCKALKTELNTEWKSEKFEKSHPVFTSSVQDYRNRLQSLKSDPNNISLVDEGRKLFRKNCLVCHRKENGQGPDSLKVVPNTDLPDQSLDYFFGFWLKTTLGGEAYFLDAAFEKRMPPAPMKSLSETQLSELGSYLEKIGSGSWNESKDSFGPAGFDRPLPTSSFPCASPAAVSCEPNLENLEDVKNEEN